MQPTPGAAASPAPLIEVRDLVAHYGFAPPFDKARNVSSEVLDADGQLLRAFATSEGRWRLATAAADVELDPAKRADLYKQAQQVLLADFPSAFGYNSANAYMVKPWVKGIEKNKAGENVTDGNIYVGMLQHLYIVERG